MVQYPFSDAPKPAELIEVAPRVQWLRMPLPFALNHINLWLLDDGDSYTLVDTGIDMDITRTTWQQLMVGPLAHKKIGRVICTHFHPDHMGLAGWFARDFSLPIHMTPGEFEAAKLWHGKRNQALLDKLSDYLARGGIEPGQARSAVESRGKMPTLVSSVPETIVPIDPALPITAGGTSWRVLIGEGHAPQLVTLYSAEHNTLISSDQILPQISPNVSVSMFTPEADPLSLFISGFGKFKALPEDTLVLPSHRLPFYGLHSRVDALIAHHDDRLAAALNACAEEATAYVVMAKLFPRMLDAHQTFFALGETLAHLNYLIGRGQLRRTTTSDGVWLYRTA
ncbi:MAG: MBL fold metallo-hydrolase [Rhodospirillaceae bacterium]|nr:MBL fold metallo-hydrolase [Rhodospirillaceae bacterium]